KVVARPAVPPAPPEEPRRRVELGAVARRRLAPALQILVERGPGAPGAATPVDGWIAVEVELADDSSADVRRLEEAGLIVQSAGEKRLRGIVAVDRLTSLAESAGVVLVKDRPA